MDFLPIFMDIRHQPVLVVGGGKVAARKVRLLRKAGGEITVVAPELCEELAEQRAAGHVRHVARKFEAADLDTPVLIIAATDDREVNRAISESARAARVPVNVVDDPELCGFIMPSIIDRSPVQIAISTGGSSPVLARLLRSKLESCTPATYGKLATLVNDFRDRVKERFADESQRKQFWEQILEGEVAELVFAGKEKAAREALSAAIASADPSGMPKGEVYLVGSGPGDPDLLTFRALRLMQQADVVVYDRLVSKQILELVRRDAELVYAGKERDNHTLPQEHINQLLVKYARKGYRVLRLKGGDPFIFGRGGEEIATLMEEGISFQVVPGITAAAGCASYAGIPLTHRDHAQSCVFVTGNLKDGSLDLNWQALAHPNQTIVFYMGLHGVQTICTKLMEHGLGADTPAALVQQGTTPNQRVFTGTLASLPELVENNDVRPPTLIIVGSVVSLQDKLAWFEPVTTETEQKDIFSSNPGRDGKSEKR